MVSTCAVALCEGLGSVCRRAGSRPLGRDAVAGSAGVSLAARAEVEGAALLPPLPRTYGKELQSMKYILSVFNDGNKNLVYE